ncbi:MAG: hypothetical protein ACLPZ0_19500 [Steroidobacteraceae bacterium]
MILAQIENEDHAWFGADPDPEGNPEILHEPMEGLMCKSLVTIAAALAILSLGSLASDRAQAGGATSAPSKYNNATHTANLVQVRHHQRVQAAEFGITEFSSSSAKTSVPKR